MEAITLHKNTGTIACYCRVNTDDQILKGKIERNDEYASKESAAVLAAVAGSRTRP